MSEKQVIVTLEDGFGRVQTSIATSLSAPQLMDKIMGIDEQQATIEELQQKYDKLCIEMANIYSKYIFMKEFSEDTNPNEAVKYVLRELMQKTKEAR